MDKTHRPVFLKEVIGLIEIYKGGQYLDLTFGEGGHTEALFEVGAASVIGVDRDKEAISRYQAEGKLKNDPRLKLVHGCFSHIGKLVKDAAFDGAIMDLGVSTLQLLEAERGFSFNYEGPLDMRMDPTHDLSLKEVLAKISKDELALAISKNTDMKKPDRIARNILEAFDSGKLETTLDLAGLFSRDRHGRRHPATVIFLALRMLVNDELGEVEKGIPAVLDKLRPGARLAVISFHSAEDRRVKWVFKELAGQCVCALPVCFCPRVKQVDFILKKPLIPCREEMASNPRARSAKLRCVEKVAL